jgi:y4mF family transcriptional regulator
MNIEELAQIIKTKRKAEGLTQKDIALSTGIGLRYISDLENAKQTCEIGKAFQILEALGIKLQVYESA